MLTVQTALQTAERTKAHNAVIQRCADYLGLEPKRVAKLWDGLTRSPQPAHRFVALAFSSMAIPGRVPVDPQRLLTCLADLHHAGALSLYERNILTHAVQARTDRYGCWRNP